MKEQKPESKLTKSKKPKKPKKAELQRRIGVWIDPTWTDEDWGVKKPKKEKPPK